MYCSRKIFTIGVIFLCNISISKALVDDILDVLHLSKEIAGGVLRAWDIVEQTNLAENIELPITREKQKKVLRRLTELSRKIDRSELQYTNAAAWTIESINQYIKQNTRLELGLHEVDDIVHRVSARSKQMQVYTEHRKTLEQSTLLNFAEWTVSPNADAINHLLERLSLLFTGSSDSRGGGPSKSVLSQLATQLEDAREQICATRQSAQQFLFSLYSDISLTELKGYTMMQFSWMILKIYEKGNFTQEAALNREEFEKRTENTQKLLREVMKRSERTVWRCDPQEHIHGQTYDEVTRLLQGYVENEVDMNPDQACRENCGYYSLTSSHGCFKDLFCSRQPRCSGKLLDCTYIDSDMWVCPSGVNSTRRYDYIEYESGRVLGKKGHCVRGSTKVDSWWRYLFWHCSYCFCLCDEQGIKSDRYFSLKPVTSDIRSNMVVSGVRLIKHKRIFHLQIQQGNLLKQGFIDPQSLRWKDIEGFQIFDRGVKSGVDYHTLAWDRREVDLDDITGDDPMQVVTGVKFRTIGTHLNLEIRLTEFDFETGALVDPETTSVWKSNDNTEYTAERRTKVQLKSPDIPVKTLAKSVPISKHNQYVEFTNSDMDKDAAQSTVPFIDMQEVTSNPAVPLSGIGLYLKVRDGYGGFLAPRIVTYDFTPHISAPSFSKK